MILIEIQLSLQLIVRRSNLASGSSFPYLFVFRHILNVILLCTIAYSLVFHCSVANAVQVSKAWGCEAAPTVQYVDVFKMITYRHTEPGSTDQHK